MADESERAVQPAIAAEMRLLDRYVRASPALVSELLDPAAVSVEPGLADVVTLQGRRQARMSAVDEESFFLDTLSEYQWARDRGRFGAGDARRPAQAGGGGLRVLRHRAVAALPS